jgi:hypothetical protein
MGDQVHCRMGGMEMELTVVYNLNAAQAFTWAGLIIGGLAVVGLAGLGVWRVVKGGRNG